MARLFLAFNSRHYLCLTLVVPFSLFLLAHLAAGKKRNEGPKGVLFVMPFKGKEGGRGREPVERELCYLQPRACRHASLEASWCSFRHIIVLAFAICNMAKPSMKYVPYLYAYESPPMGLEMMVVHGRMKIVPAVAGLFSPTLAGSCLTMFAKIISGRIRRLHWLKSMLQVA